MTARHEHRPLSSYPPETLGALGSHVVALLRYGDLLPTDLPVKLDLLHDDIRQAITRSTRQAATFTPRPVATAGRSDGHM
jgi:hypothetical protein